MIVKSIQNKQYPAPQTSFKSNRRIVKDKNGKIMYRTTTYFFRPGFDWSQFTNYLDSKYKQVPKVNIIDHICSNGPEAYSIVMKLLTKIGQRAEKFFPIIAKDINKENIEMAQNSTPIGIDDVEMFHANYHTNNNFFTYFTPVSPENTNDDIAVVPNKNIREKVKFSLGDIFQDIDSAPSSNTVFLCRNFWPYLNEQQREQLVKKMSKFDYTSLVVIGEFDTEHSNIEALLEKYKFIRTPVSYVYTKQEPFKHAHPNLYRIVHNFYSSNNKQVPQQKPNNKNLSK